MLTNLYKQQHTKHLLSRGFTIVELLVVIAIIGILATITVISYNGLTRKASTVVLQSDLDNAAAQLALDKITSGSYPDTKEAANGGDGLKASTGVSFDYHRINKTYCLEAFNGDGVYYHVSSSNSSPTEGNCSMSFVTVWDPVCNEEFCSDFAGTTIIQTSDNGYVVAGSDKIMGGLAGGSMILLRFDNFGSLSWSKAWGSSYDYEKDLVNAIVQTSDGGFVVTGTTDSYGAGGNDMFLTKFSSTGSLSWSKTWGGTGNDTGNSIVQTSDGSLVVTGTTNSYGAGGNDMFLTKFSSTGSLLWSKTWGGTGNDTGVSLFQTNDGGFVVTGSADDGSSGMYIARYNSSGTPLWSKTMSWFSSNSIIQTNDGDFVVTGTTDSYGAGDNDVFLARFDQSGNLLWVKTWGGTDSDTGASLVQTSDWGVAVTGETWSFGLYSSFLIKFNSSGDIVWNKLFGPMGGSYSYSSALIKTNDNGYAITGYAPSFSAPYIAKYNISGDISGCSESMCKSIDVADLNQTISESSLAATNLSPSALTYDATFSVNSPVTTSTTLVDAKY